LSKEKISFYGRCSEVRESQKYNVYSKEREQEFSGDNDEASPIQDQKT
jgi:hypothetical protein